ncbi:TspO/MBR family protein [Natronoflexus pectinivorans]|uniref:TspO/MBR related protein n=1 Tax=Natronoflexus pectinivorans TaxID=682526 RepID=A0A4R2GJ76_9BACT|nr:TspO/MBR family protein [Natronoflexus pectinivorans]TCO08475.1 TspO/MBR related protein [Natronoflexus pectinivorans]
MKKFLLLKLLVSIALPLGVGAIAGMFTAQAVPEWYASLNRPWFSPPNWIFGPVWTTLYLLMGISFFLVWKQDASRERNLAIIVFLIQLLLNFAWSFLFFYFKMPGLALIEIILLWVSIILMFFAFYKVKPMAAYLNIPYFLWVSFAIALNAGFYFLNRG